MLRDGLAKFRCVADLDTDKPKAVNIEEASKNSIVPRISGMQRLFRIVYLPLSGGVCPSPKRMLRCAGLLGGPPYGEMDLGLAFENEGGKCLRAA